VTGARDWVRSHPRLHAALRPSVDLGRRLRAAVGRLWRGERRHTRRFRRSLAWITESVPEPYFVKVGAHDGTTGDPCADVLRDRWHGLLVEPVPYLFDRLRANYPDRSRFALEQVAVDARAGTRTFYYVDPAAARAAPGLPAWVDQLGSFDRAHVTGVLGGALEPFLVEREVDTLPLSRIVGRSERRDIHLLHVDAEGHDDEVLYSLDFRTHRPVVVFVEHKCLPADRAAAMRRFLRGLGYAVGDCGADYCATDEAALRRLRARRPPPPRAS
jgi:FkbM family methyltransferase